VFGAAEKPLRKDAVVKIILHSCKNAFKSEVGKCLTLKKCEGVKIGFAIYYI
jgi:hypothetical protein